MKRLIYPALLGLALAGCAQAEKEEAAVDYSASETTAEAPAANAAEPAAAVALPAARTAGLNQHPAGRSVIYHGQLRLRVENFEQTSARLDQLLTDHEAVLGTAHETRSGGQHQQELSIKVPPRQFLPLVSAIGRLGRIDSKDVSSSDATADLLAAEKAAAAKLAAAQTRQTAQPGSEAAALIQQRQTEAQHAQALASSLRQQTQWATLTVYLYQPLAEEESAEPLPAYGPRFAAAFLRGGGIFLDVLVGLTNLWPLLTLAGLGYWAVRRWRRVHSQV